MSRITIDVAKEELEFIREALAQKYRSLISYLDECENVANTPPSKESVLHEAHKQLNLEISKWIENDKRPSEWTVTSTDGTIVAAKKRGRPSKKAAPYGLKKDGTPKKRPGRQKVAA